MDVELVLAFINAVHRTDVHAGSILDSDAGFDNHIGHATAPEANTAAWNGALAKGIRRGMKRRKGRV
jgi:hypothetical protein